MVPKKIVILGSTGSIGINALNVVTRFPERFQVVGLSCYNSFSIFEKQVQQFQPSMVALTRSGIERLRGFGGVFATLRMFDVETELAEMVTQPGVDVVVLGMRGSAALLPFLAAVRAGKTVAPANKEALVIAGDQIMEEARIYGSRIIPVDSEQSAIFQCLEGATAQIVKRIYLTASGGALRAVPLERFEELTRDDILRHPRWKMGPKITVDSATLLNKGFEVIEAMRLFRLLASQIEVLIHPEAIIHSMVEFVDGAIMAQMGVTDMRLPIQYALTYPERLPTGLPEVNFTDLQALHFEKPDLDKFPLFELALDVARKEGTLPAVLNAADEVAVEAFLKDEINLTRVCEVVQKVVQLHCSRKHPSITEILEADRWAREETLIQLER